MGPAHTQLSFRHPALRSKAKENPGDYAGAQHLSWIAVPGFGEGAVANPLVAPTCAAHGSGLSHN